MQEASYCETWKKICVENLSSGQSWRRLQPEQPGQQHVGLEVQLHSEKEQVVEAAIRPTGKVTEKNEWCEHNDMYQLSVY